MERLLGDELHHLVTLIQLRSVMDSEYLREFIDNIARETYTRIKLLDVLSTPEISITKAERRPLEEVVKSLEDMCSHYEQHLTEVKKLRERAKTPLELEVALAIEKSVERTHVALRMFINALTESRR